MKIFVPQDSVAIALGADEIAAIAGTKAQVIRNSSWGLHYLEPLIEVETQSGRVGFARVSPDEIAQVIADNFPITHPKYIGEVEELPAIKLQTRQSFFRAGLNDPLDYSGFISLNGTMALRKAFKIGAQAVVDEVKASGLRGRGGAGFPAGIKWQSVKDAKSYAKYIVCNADEGDSGNFADRAYLEGDPFGLFEAMAIAGFAIGAQKGFIYLRSEYPKAIEILTAALEIARDKKLLGRNVLGSEFAFDIELRVGAGAYVCGEETALLESIEGKRGMVRSKPPIPAFEGLFGKPTLINNVLSFAAIGGIILGGGAHYSSLGFEKSKGTMAVQLSGNIKNSGLYEIEFGKSLREIIFEIGGDLRKGDFGAAQIGGPLGAYVGKSQLDLPFDYEALANNNALLGHGSIVVFDDRIDFLKMARFAFEFCAAESCGKCTPCRIGSTRGVETMDKIINGEDHFALIDDLNHTMKFGSLCALGGFTNYPVSSAIRIHKEIKEGALANV